MERKPLTGIVLAGGKSSRMGRDKALIEINGKPMIRHAVDMLKSFCEEILISANDVDAYSFLNEKTVTDEIPGLGPAGGIYSCLKQSSSEMNFVLACDIPFISGELTGYILDHAGKAELVIPQSADGRLEPLCAVYHTTVLPHIKRMIEEKDLKIQNLRNYCKTMILRLPEDRFSSSLFTNMNKPADLINE